MFEVISKIEDKYAVKELLGKGLHSSVFRGECLESGVAVALKFSKKIITQRQDKEARDCFQAEAYILSSLNHKNIVSIISSYTVPRHLCIVLEYLSGPELFDYLMNLLICNEKQTKNIAKQILDALEHMHSKNIAHFDLKPENIVLADKNSMQVKIIDFSLACVVDPESPVKKLGGTAEFMSPEAISYRTIETSSDMWSYGVLLYLIATGYSPFLGENATDTQNNITKNIIDYDIPELKQCSPHLTSLIKGLLKIEPRERLTAAECQNHDWFKSTEEVLGRRLSVNPKAFEKFKDRCKIMIGMNRVVRYSTAGQVCKSQSTTD